MPLNDPGFVLVTPTFQKLSIFGFWAFSFPQKSRLIKNPEILESIENPGIYQDCQEYQD